MLHKTTKQNKAKPITSGIAYAGPSLIDGKPIVLILIGESDNSKTGNMVQSYIIRSDIDPITANRIGADYSICGNCKHRGIANPDKIKGLADNRSCYVNIGQGVLQVYKAFIAGKYPILDNDQLQSMLSGRMLRIGSYGDAMAVPQGVINTLIGYASGHTAYTHQYSMIKPDQPLPYMVSADSEIDAVAFHSRGYRTFRVVPIADINKPLLSNEIECPSYKGIECRDCRLCNGNKSKGKSIAILAHGIGAKHHN